MPKPSQHPSRTFTQPLGNTHPSRAVVREKPQFSMRIVPSRLIALLLPALLLGGCHAAIWAHFAVLAISVGIFVGTVSLDQPGRQAPSETGSAQQGWSQAPRGR